MKPRPGHQWRWARDYIATFAYTKWECCRCEAVHFAQGSDQSAPEEVPGPPCGDRVAKRILES